MGEGEERNLKLLQGVEPRLLAHSFLRQVTVITELLPHNILQNIILESDCVLSNCPWLPHLRTSGFCA